MLEDRLSNETGKSYAESRRKWTYEFQLIEIEEDEAFDSINNHEFIADP